MARNLGRHRPSSRGVFPTEEWFTRAQGIDSPKGLFRVASQWRLCRVAFSGTTFDSYLTCCARVILDSQCPRITLATKKHNIPEGGHLVFAAHDHEFRTVVNDYELREQRPLLYRDARQASWYIKITPRKLPGYICEAGAPWNLEGEEAETWKMLRENAFKATSIYVLQEGPHVPPDLRETHSWLNVIQQKVRANKDSNGKPQAFWAFHQRRQREEERGPQADKYIETLNWLWKSNDNYTTWVPHEPYFYDEDDRWWRLVEATRIERAGRRHAIADIFCQQRRHDAWVERFGNHGDWLVHCRIVFSQGEAPVTPEICVGERVELSFAASDDQPQEIKVTYSGMVVDEPTSKDVVILLKNASYLNLNEAKRYKIIALIQPSFLPIDQQLRALKGAGSHRSYGDQHGQEKQGFSLRRMILAHGKELNPSSGEYFTLNITEMSSIPVNLRRERLDYILQKYPLDEVQWTAFQRSTTAICAGIHLIQGPPGTGKTRLGMVIILAFAALDFKVLLTAASSKATDNLAAAVATVLQQDTRLGIWCGQLVRFCAPAKQLAYVRTRTCSLMADEGSAAKVLEGIQMHKMVLEYASNHRDKRTCRDFEEMLERDRRQGLSKETSEQLKGQYETISRLILSRSKIVASTLSNCGADPLSLLEVFKPDFLVSDGSNQSLEGESMIGLMRPSIKGVILIGDHKELLPTVTTETGANEGAQFLKRSLMKRLFDAGYPSTTLLTNYRSHPAILDFYSRHVYEGKLKPAALNSELERVGCAWDSFTTSVAIFRSAGVENVRRLFIDVLGFATQHPNSSSWFNDHQVEAAGHLLQALYRHGSQHECIRPQDVLIISPYNDQQRQVSARFREWGIGVGENMTVVTSQGQEANVVICLMTKPSANIRSVHFLADRHWMSVALSRAKKVLIIIGNMQHGFNQETRARLKSSGKNKLLVAFLEDVMEKNHIMTYQGSETFTAANVDKVHTPGLQDESDLNPVGPPKETWQDPQTRTVFDGEIQTSRSLLNIHRPVIEPPVEQAATHERPQALQDEDEDDDDMDLRRKRIELRLRRIELEEELLDLELEERRLKRARHN